MFYVIHIALKQLYGNKEQSNVLFAKLINYVTTSISAVKQLYRNQQCHVMLMLC